MGDTQEKIEREARKWAYTQSPTYGVPGKNHLRPTYWKP